MPPCAQRSRHESDCRIRRFVRGGTNPRVSDLPIDVQDTAVQETRMAARWTH